MVHSRPLISKSFSPCANLMVTVPRATITIGVNVTFIIIIIIISCDFISLVLTDVFFFTGLCDSKPPQVSRTLQSIPGDFDNNVVMISFSFSSNLFFIQSFFQILQWSVPRAATKIGITFILHNFLVLEQVPVICPVFRLPSLSPSSLLAQQSPRDDKLFSSC